MTNTVLILGASGRFGRTAAEQFATAGWEVRRFVRSRDTLTEAARRVDVIVNAWNPAYPDWQAQVPDLHAQVIDAARRSGATVIVPGNVYVFGADTPGPWSHTSAHRARNRLGRIRIEMEAGYRRAGVRTIILRAGDFLDTRASGNWFDQIMIKRLSKGIFRYPGNPSIAHAWAFLPDLCRAAVLLAEKRADLPAFCDVAFPGYSLSGDDIADRLARICGHLVGVKQMSWLPLHIARPFWRMAGYLTEMRYLWNTPHHLDGALFDALLPGFTPTPPDQALAAAVSGASVQPQIDPDQTVAAGV